VSRCVLDEEIRSRHQLCQRPYGRYFGAGCKAATMATSKKYGEKWNIGPACIYHDVRLSFKERLIVFVQVSLVQKLNETIESRKAKKCRKFPQLLSRDFG
jgi:hypothetical protein